MCAFVQTIPVHLHDANKYTSLISSTSLKRMTTNVSRRPRSYSYVVTQACISSSSSSSSSELEKPYQLEPSGQYIADVLEIPARIALTREMGKNDALRNLLEEMLEPIEVVEVPCVRTVRLSDFEILCNRLKNHNNYNSSSSSSSCWMILTSPEAATILIEAWRHVGYPKFTSTFKLAVVGKSTGDHLRAVGFNIDFIPSKATGKTLINEFPNKKEGKVIYPASKKASDDIVNGLTSKGYSVERINTYSTEVDTFDELKLELCKGSHIVTFASPSAVKSWRDNIGVQQNVIVACIGETSAKAARDVGFTRVHYPEKPGLDGWVTAVCEALRVYNNDKQIEEKEKEKEKEKKQLQN